MVLVVHRFQELDLAPELQELFFFVPILECLYYTAKYEGICIYCAQQLPAGEEKYPPKNEQAKYF